MSNLARIVSFLLLLGVAAAGGYYLLSKQADPVVAPTGLTPADDDSSANTPADDEQQPEPAAGDTAAAPPPVQRTIAQHDASDAHTDAKQGVVGRVLLPDGGPAAGVEVVLVQNFTNNLLDGFLMSQTGKLPPPISSGVTAADGTFALGLPKTGKKVDLRVISNSHPELVRQGLKIARGDWYDALELRLERGITVQGVLLAEGTSQPIPDASVWLRPTGNTQQLISTPGREQGTEARTDAQGRFRFDNAPRQGLVNLVAEAPGFASTSLLNQQLSVNEPNEFRLTLEAGRPITGVVVDETGNRIRGATITATGLSQKTPQTATVTSDAEGEYVFETLRPGPYRVTAHAPRFDDAIAPIALTDEDVKLVMTRRSQVRLQVLSADNRPLKDFELSLKRTFPNNPDGLANVIGFVDRHITPRDFEDGWAIVDGLPTGTFKFQLTAAGHAKSLSPAFEVVQGEAPPEVIAVLTVGATITGTVIDDRGNPVQGAVVTTDMNSGLAANTGLLEIFGSMLPKKHSAKTVHTDAQGRFVIDQLAFADYMVRVSHERYCEGTAIDISLREAGQVVDAGVIQLELGTLIEGVTSVDGVPMGQIKVMISVPPPENGQPIAVSNPGGEAPTSEQKRAAARALFSTHAISNGNGQYSMLKRVPPGTYKITASRQTSGNPFEALLDMKQSAKVITIGTGEDRRKVDFSLPGS